MKKVVYRVSRYQEWKRRVEEDEKNWDSDMYLYPDFDWYDLGHYFIHDVYCHEIPDWLENYIDYARYGEELHFDGFHEYSGGIVEIRR